MNTFDEIIRFISENYDPDGLITHESNAADEYATYRKCCTRNGWTRKLTSKDFARYIEMLVDDHKAEQAEQADDDNA